MTHVATLIAHPTQPIPEDTGWQAARNLPAAEAPAWLDPGVALDIPFIPPGGNDNRITSETLRGALGGARIDVVVQQATGRRKRLLLADMDSTMIDQECLDELADFVGQKARVAAITERAMRGEVEFAPALRERVALLAGLPAGVVEEVIAKRITLTPGARTLVQTMRRHGAYTCLVSGGFTVFTARIAALIGFDENCGNWLVVGEDGRFLGTVAEPVMARDAAGIAPHARSCAARDTGGWRRRQRPEDDRRCRPRRRLPGEAAGGRNRRRAHRPRRSHGAALCAGLSPRGVCRGVESLPVFGEGGRAERGRVGVAAQPHPRAKARHPPRRRGGKKPYCKLSATKRSSPSALATSNSADLRPSFLSWSTRFCSASVSATASCDTSTTTSPALRRLSAAGDWASTPVITTPFTLSLIL